MLKTCFLFGHLLLKDLPQLLNWSQLTHDKMESFYWPLKSKTSFWIFQNPYYQNPYYANKTWLIWRCFAHTLAENKPVYNDRIITVNQSFSVKKTHAAWWWSCKIELLPVSYKQMFVMMFCQLPLCSCQIVTWVIRLRASANIKKQMSDKNTAGEWNALFSSIFEIIVGFCTNRDDDR